MVNGETKIIFNKLFRLYVIRLSLMIFFKQILYLIYSKYLLDLYDNKKQVITIIDNFYLSLNQFNFFFKNCYLYIFTLSVDNEYYFYNNIFLSSKIKPFFKSYKICK